MLDMRTMMNRLEFSEGFVVHPEKCPAGRLTIGFGRNVDDNPLDAEEQRHLGCGPKGPNPITKEQAEYLLQSDINKCIKSLDKRFPWWKNLDSERQYLLIDMAFNMGINGLSKHKTMLQCMKEGRFDEAAEAIRNTKYFKQVGHRSARNYVLMKTGVYNKNVTQRTIGQYTSGNVSSAPAPTYTSSSNSSNTGTAVASSSSSGTGTSSTNDTSSPSSRKTRKIMKRDQKTAQKAKKSEAKAKKEEEKAAQKIQQEKEKAERKAQKAAEKAAKQEAEAKKKMEEMIVKLNTREKAKIDPRKSADVLYKAHGKDAVKKLKTAIKHPKKYKAKTSQEAVNGLLKAAKEKLDTQKKSLMPKFFKSQKDR